jgi:hypothetical protein
VVSASLAGLLLRAILVVRPVVVHPLSIDGEASASPFLVWWWLKLVACILIPHLHSSRPAPAASGSRWTARAKALLGCIQCWPQWRMRASLPPWRHGHGPHWTSLSSNDGGNPRSGTLDQAAVTQHFYLLKTSSRLNEDKPMWKLEARTMWCMPVLAAA